jgi:hypothetical protein
LRRCALTMILILLLLAGARPVPAGQEQAVEAEIPEGRHYPINFSLYYPVSLNRSKHDRVNVNLSLIYGRVGYVGGLDLSLMASGIEHDMRGIQISGLIAAAGESGEGWQSAGLIGVAGERFSGVQTAGLISVAGEDLVGLQLAGLLSVAGQDGRWLQASGLGSVAGKSFRGAQLAGGFNVIGEKGSALQASGLFNVIGERGRGLQAAGLFNVTGESFRGVQAAGLFNVVGDKLRGLQMGGANIAVRSQGLQIGIVNIADKTRGFQLGLVNYAKRDNTGAAFGPINIARNGTVKAILWGGLDNALSGGVRCRLGRTYSIASLGIGNLHDKITGAFAYGFHYGVSFPMSRSELGVDIGYRYRDNRPHFKHPEGQPDQHMLEARLLWTLPLSHKVSLLLGGGIGRRFDVGLPIDSGVTSPLVVAGLEFN